MISGFHEWALSTQISHVLPLDQLRNHRLGVEAEDYINVLVSNSPTREPLLIALGGLPFSLEETVKKHLSILEQNGIQPYFIFNGLNLNGQDDKVQAMLTALKSIASAWNLYGASQPNDAVVEFGKLCKRASVSCILTGVAKSLTTQKVLLILIMSIVTCKPSLRSEVWTI